MHLTTTKLYLPNFIARLKHKNKLSRVGEYYALFVFMKLLYHKMR